uniref:Ribonuclease H-like domain-containing protein n=1 Tax=Tanacetum cinerariifolium TaxID=118510 RepID=A0A6L2L137_TANCI|nr:ribonuclease H-like domain-containing protein [Tanacetum cinerariifolium]
MVTHSKVGIVKKNPKFACHVSISSSIPRSHIHAFRDPNWQHVMLDEYNALISNGTWVLVPRPQNVNIVRSMWLLKHKFNADGSLSWYKASLVANGRNQQQGIDCDETFSLVVKPATIHTVLSLAVSRQWPIHQLDVKNAFLNGHLSETMYMHQPPGFFDLAHPRHVCLLQKSLYGIKQAPRAWFQRFASYATRTKYAREILERAGMMNCNPCKTPTDTYFKLGPDGDPVCLYMHDPREPRLSAMKCLLRYVHGTLDHGLQLYTSLTSQLIAYSNADWAGCPTTRRSTSVSKQDIIAFANAVVKTAWVRNLLHELLMPLRTTILFYCDNVSAVYSSCNLVQHQRTKHIEIDINFVHEFVATSYVRVLHVPSRYQFADIFIKVEVVVVAMVVRVSQASDQEDMSSRNGLVGCGEGVFFKKDGVDCGFDSNDEEVVPKVDDVSLVDEVLDGAFGGVEMKIF